LAFQPGSVLYTQGFGLRPENVEVPRIEVRDPTINDTNWPLGKRWVNRLTNNEWTLTSLSSSPTGFLANWLTLGGGAGAGVNYILTGDNVLVAPNTNVINMIGDGTFLTTTGLNPEGRVTVAPKSNLLTLVNTDLGSATPDGTGLLTVHGTTHNPSGIPFRFTGATNTVTGTVQLASSGGISSASTAGVASFNNSNFSVDANGYVTLIGTGGSTEITPYVVGPLANGASYTTIQGAVTAAHSISPSGAQIYAQPKADGSTYTENLTLFANQTICSFDSNSIVSITGSHTPPASGNITFQGVNLITTSTNNLIEAGSATTSASFTFDNCNFSINSGYIYHAAGSAATGSVTLLNCRDASAANGIVNATAANLFLKGNTIGGGATSCTCNSLTCFSSTISISGNFTLNGGVSYFFETNLNGTLTLVNSAHVFGFNDQFITNFNNSNACLNVGASAQASFWDSTFNSSATYSVTGTGTVTLQNCSYPQGHPIDPGLTTTINGTVIADSFDAETGYEWGLPGSTAFGSLTSDVNFAKFTSLTADTGVLLSGNGAFDPTAGNGVGIGHGGGFMVGDGTLLTVSPNTSPFVAGSYSAGQFELVSGTVTVSTNIFNGQNASDCFIYPSICYSASNQGFLTVSITPASGFTVTSTNSGDGSAYGWYAVLLSTFTASPPPASPLLVKRKNKNPGPLTRLKNFFKRLTHG